MTAQVDSKGFAKFIPVTGSVNLRDFGGHKTLDGRTVKHGVLYRCGSMTDIPTHAWDDFSALDISVICDLRSEEETLESPTPAGGPFECRVHIPIWPGSSTQFQSTVRDTRPTLDDFTSFMETITREIARDHATAYQQLMLELINTERGFLLHCSAGKDRTGFGAAIILSALGVDRDTIFKDYLASNESEELLERMRIRMNENVAAENPGMKVSEEVLAIFAGVRAEYLHAAFEEVDNHFGGIEGYLEAVGITEKETEHLKARLLE